MEIIDLSLIILHFYYFISETRENFLNFILTLYIWFYARYNKYIYAHSLYMANRRRKDKEFDNRVSKIISLDLI